jgi:hypothetical protein
LDREREQYVGVVIAGDAVAPEHAAGSATVNEGPFSAFANPNGDWIHHSAASGTSITRNFVEVNAMQALGTMVSLARADSADRNSEAAMTTSESVILWFQE